MLLSCSADRGIIVWSWSNETNKYIPTLCAVKELKANLDASWNKRGDKFCVGASSGHVFTGKYNPDLGFWVALSQTEEPPLGKPLHKASVLSVKFDPGSGRAVASASADGTVIITSAYEPTLDTDGDGPFAGITVESGEILFRFKSSCWNNTLCFSPSGQTLAFASHDCEMHFIDITAEMVANYTKSKPKSQKVVYKGNPILNGWFLNETTYVGGGYDCAPLVFKKKGDNWEHTGTLDDGLSRTKDTKIGMNTFDKTALFDQKGISEVY